MNPIHFNEMKGRNKKPITSFIYFIDFAFFILFNILDVQVWNLVVLSETLFSSINSETSSRKQIKY